MNKHGDVDWFIVTIIISILTLVVFILIAIFFPFSETIDRVACQESIVLRATLPGDTINVKDFVSVRCKARNICVTAKSSGKGNCTSLGKDFETNRLTATETVLKKEQIRMFLAREMADCWGMFGEGKLQIFSREFEASGYESKGIICDKIEFDNSITAGEEPIKYLEDFTRYMAFHKVPGQNYSYMDYLRNTPEGESAANLYGPLVNQNVTDFTKKADSISLSGVKSIVYIESTLSNFGKMIGGGVGATAGAVGAFYTKGFGWKYLIGGGTILGGLAGDSLQKWVYSDVFCTKNPKDNQCSSFVGGQVLTDYSAEGFKNFNIASFENL